MNTDLSSKSTVGRTNGTMRNVLRYNMFIQFNVETVNNHPHEMRKKNNSECEFEYTSI